MDVKAKYSPLFKSEIPILTSLNVQIHLVVVCLKLLFFFSFTFPPPSIQAGSGTSQTSTLTPPTACPQTPPRFASLPKASPSPAPACTGTSCVTLPTASSSQRSVTWHRSHSHRTSSYGPGRYMTEWGWKWML